MLQVFWEACQIKGIWGGARGMDVFKLVAGLGLGSLGMASNLLLLLAVYRSNSRCNRLNLQLVAPIAILDFLGSFVIVLTYILSLAKGKSELFTSSWFCPLFGTWLLIIPSLVTVLVSGMALDRYLIVVHSRGIPRLWGWLCVSTVCCSFTATVLVNTIVYDIIPDPTMTYCKPIGSDLLASIIRHYSTAIVFVGLFIITFSYFGVYSHCRKSLATFHVLPDRYLIFPISYLVCLLPRFTYIIWSFFEEINVIPPLLLTLGIMGYILLYVANPCLVFGFQSDLRKEAFHVFLPRPASPPVQIPMPNIVKDSCYYSIP
ncbi:hypothetical protein DSO57_1032284 [Entomophthora muscae]|uniref:Uncharacterized protein n=1 Tax=Entomophthora muscae TaxID=34485 RepID=A0ACC2TBL6_9FUNG|nr:hypothetical protein DSO57_1032284 [Entomophthora muscae]